jgi:addiction module HigA family antidote
MERLPNIHPGEILREDYLVPLEMSAYRLAKGLGMSQTAVGEILRGKRAITPATALRLERFFGSSAEFWLNLQVAYDLEEERRSQGALPAEVLPCDLAEERRCQLRGQEERRKRYVETLAQERARMVATIEKIRPLDTGEVEALPAAQRD